MKRLLALLLLCFSAVLHAAAPPPAEAPAAPAPISFSAIGAKATADYQGDAIGITTTADGATLRTGFQKLAGTVTREGLSLESTAEGGGSLKLTANAIGRVEGQAVPLPQAGSVACADQLVTFTRPGLTEEYSVSVDGVRQDFIVMQRPTGDGRLSVELALSGATAETAEDGVKLTLNSSARALAYNRLNVTDATGRVLSATMEVLSPSRLAVRVDDAGAAYPVRIDPTFSDADWVSLSAGIPGANGNVNATVVDSSGNLYIGGAFTFAGAVTANRIAKWNGSAWSALGTGMNADVNALAVDSSGNLYAGGAFTSAGGVANTSRIAKWDGSAWLALGTGMNNTVNALAVDTSNNVYAGGAFTTAGGVTVNRVAKWNGSTWLALGTGMNSGTVSALAVDSSGNLCAGGSFTSADGVANTSRIAKWGGSAWSALGTGMDAQVNALAVSGSNLYAGGTFTSAGGTSASKIAMWNGTAWSALGAGTDNTVYALAVDGSSNLYAGGVFTHAGGGFAWNIAKWNGSAWSGLGSSFSFQAQVSALALDSSGNVYAGGTFTRVGVAGTPITRGKYVAKWNGSAWSSLGSGMDNSVNAVAVSGTNLYVGGSFISAGGVTAINIAKWDGSAWSALGSGMNNGVLALAVDSSGNLYAGGNSSTAGGVSANFIAKWNGSAWSALGSGMNSLVSALAVDSSNNLYAGGLFTTAGGVSANYVAKWNGSAWSAVGSGMNGQVSTLAVSGTNLYAGGAFTTADGASANYVAKFNGSAWSNLGTGMDSSVSALAVSGSNVYAGGAFTTAGGGSASKIAKWDGSTWSALGSGMNNNVNALVLGGPTLYAGGNFTTAGGVSVTYIAKWDGSAWSSLGTGVDNVVNALALTTGGNLYLGGNFTFVGTTTVSPFIAQATLPFPTLTSLNVTSGSNAGGTRVTLTGTNFTGATGVTFGGVAATSVNVVNDTTITAVTPAGTVGSTSVVVTTPYGSNAANTVFTYISTTEMELSVLSNSYSNVFFPSSNASVSAAANVTFTKSFSTDGQTTMAFHFKAPAGKRFRATAPSGWSSYQLTFILSGGSLGVPGGQHNDTSPVLTFDVPAGSTPTLSGATVNFTGPNSLAPPAADSFSVSANYTLNAGDSFTCEGITISTTVPAGYDNDFTNVSATATLRGTAATFSGSPADPGQWVTLESNAASAPTVASLNITSGSTAGGTNVTITGSGFTGATGVTFGGVAATSFTVVDDTTITATTAAGSSGSASVVVSTAGGSNAANALYTYAVPDYIITTTGNAIVVTDSTGNGDTLAISEPSAGNIQFAAAGRNFTVNNGGIISGNSGTLSRTSVTSISVDAAAGADTINVGAFTGTLPNLTLNGGTGNDTVNFNGDITFASNANLDVDLQNDNATPGTDLVTVAASANILTTGNGTLVVKVSRNVLVSTGGSLETVNGGITIEADLQATATNATFDAVDVNGGTIRSTGSGNVTIAGKGGIGGGADPSGVVVRNAGVISGGTSGTVSVTGTGGIGTSTSIGTSNLVGVSVENTNSMITSTGANVQVTGTAGSSSGPSSGGVLVIGGSISAGGTGSVNVTGTGGAGTLFNYGVDVVLTGASIFSTNGPVTVTGTGGSGGGTNFGVILQLAGIISAGGTNPVTVTGTGGSGADGLNNGVMVQNANSVAKITSGGGDVIVTGTAGTGGSGATVDLGISVSDGSITTATNGGNVTLVADKMNIGAAVSANSSSTVTLRQKTNAVAINLGSAVDTTASTLELSDTELDLVTTGTLAIGDANSGTITASAAITHPNNLSLITGAGLTVSQAVTMAVNKNLTVNGVGTLAVTNANITATGTGAISMTTARDIVITGTTAPVKGISTVNGALSLSANAAGTNTDAFTGVKLNTYAVVRVTGSGNLTVVGKGGSGGGTAPSGVDVVNDSSISGGTSGTVSVTGTGGTGTSVDSGPGSMGGVKVWNTSAITSNGANVQVTGVGGTGTTEAVWGILVYVGGSHISAGGTGSVTVHGTGGSSSGGFNNGVDINAQNARISSNNGPVQVTGIGGVGGSINHGVNCRGTGDIYTGGANALTITGTGGSGTGGFHYGVQVSGSTNQLTTGGGNVIITGTPGTGGSGNVGVGSGGTLTTATNGGNISIIADSINLGGTVSTNSSGTVTLRQKTNAVAINLGSAVDTTASTLELSDAELDAITTGTLVIGDANSGLTTISDVISPAGYPTLDIQKALTFSATGGFGADLTSVAVFEKLKANGAVTITAGASLTATAAGGFVPAVGNTFTILDNISASTTTGSFSSMPEGTAVAIGGVNNTLTYAGGTGNDVVFTATTGFTPLPGVPVTYSAVIGGTTPVAITGGGTLALTNANTYTAPTNVQSGTASINTVGTGTTAQSLGAGNVVNLGVASTSSGSLVYTGGAGTLDKTINALGNGSDTVQNSGTGLLTLSGTLNKTGTTLTLQGGANGITVSGSITGNTGIPDSDLIIDGGSVTLTGANTYNGPTYIINGATLNANAADALPTSPARSAILMDQTGTGSSTLSLGVSQSVLSLTGASTSALNLNANNLTVGDSSGSTTFAGVISGTGGSLTKDGASTQILTGANTFTGTTTISAGNLTLRNTSASSAYDIAGGATLEINNAADLEYGTTTYSGTGTFKKTGAGQLSWGASSATFALGSGSLIDVQEGYMVAGSFANEVWTSNLSDLTVASGATFDGIEANIRVDALNGAGTIKSGYGGAGYVAFTLGVDNGGGTFSGVLTDRDAPGNFVKTGSGTQILSGANTYTGTTTISQGTLQLGAGSTTGSLSTSSSITNNATLAFNRSNTVTQGTDFASVISGSGAVSQAGTGTLVLSGTNTYTGATTINSGGTLQIGAGGTTGALSTSSTIANNGTLTFNRSNTITQGTDFRNVIGGTGAVIQAGSGTLVLNGANTYSGTTTVSGGTLNLSGAGNSNNSDIVMSGGSNLVFTATDSRAFSKVLSGTAGTITFNVAGNTSDSGASDGTNFALLNTNTFTGTLVVNSGLVSFAADAAFGNAANVIQLNAASGQSTGLLVASNVTLASTRAIQLTTAGGNGILRSFNGSTLQIDGVISGAGNLVKTDGGTVVLTGANTFTGSTRVGGGVLQINNALALQNSTFDTAGPGQLRLSGVTTPTLGGLTGSTNLASAIPTGYSSVTSLTINPGTGVSNTYSGVVANGAAGMSLVKTGAGTQILSGANTYTGTTTVSAGTLQAGSASAFTNKGNLQMSGSGVLDLGGFAVGFINASASATTNTITNNGAANATLNFSNLNTQISSLIQDGTRTLGVSLRNDISASNLFKLDSANTFSGGVTLLDGSATGLGFGSRLRVSNLITTVGSAGAIVSSPFGTGTITIGQAATDKAGLLFDTTASNTLANAIVFNTALGTDFPGIRVDTAATGLVLSGQITANLANAMFSNGTGGVSTVNLTGKVTGASGLETSASSIALTLNNAANNNDYAGNTITGSGSFVNLGRANQIPNGAGKGNVVNAGTLNLNGFNETINGLSGAGTIDGVSGTPTLTIGDNDAGTTYSGVLKNTAGTLALTKTGAGTMTLDGTAANTYTGTTTITGGVLVLNKSGAGSENAIASGGSIVINSGGTLRLGTQGQINDSITSFSINGGTFDMQTFTDGVNSQIALAGGSITGGDTGFVLARGGYAGTGTNTISKRISVRAADANSGLFGVTSGTTTVSGVIHTDFGGAAGISKTGTGTLVLSGANTYAGATAVSAGALQVDGSIAAGSTVGVGTAGTLSGSGTINGNATLTGSGIINKTGGSIGGTLGVTGGNWNGTGTVTGLVTSSSGTFTIGSGANLTANGNLNVTGGTIASGSGTSTITGSVNYTSSSSSTFGGVIAGSSKTVTMNNSSAILSLTGASTYTGGTTITAGVVAVGLNQGGVNGDTISGGSSTSLGSGAVSVAAGASLHINTGGLTIANDITLNGMSYGQNSGGPAATNGGPWNGAIMGNSSGGATTNILSGTITLNATSNLSTNWNDKLLVLSGKVTGVGGLVIDNSAPNNRNGGIIVLSNTTNDYQGDTTVNGGNNGGVQARLNLGAANVIPNGAGKGNLVVNGSLDLAGFSQTVNGLSGSGYIATATAGAVTLSVGNNNASSTFSGRIADDSGTVALTKIGSGTLLLNGSNIFTGNVTVNGGTLVAGGGTALGSPTVAGRTVTVNNSGSILSFATNNVFGGGNANLPSITLNSGTTLTSTNYNVLGDISLNGALLTQASINSTGYEGFQFRGTVTVGGSAASTITTTNGKGNHLAANTVFNVANVTGDSSTDLTVSVPLIDQSTDFSAAAGGLTKSGVGTMLLNAASSYTGTTTVSAGVLNIQNASALGATAAGTSVTSGAALEIQGSVTTANEALTLNGTGVSNGGALRSVSGTNNYAGLVTLGSATRINSDAGTLTLSNAGTITGSGRALTVGGAGDTIINSIIGTGTGTLTKVGAGTLTLNGVNTYTGLTDVQAGTLVIGPADVFPETAILRASGGTVSFGSDGERLGGIQLVSGSITGTTGKLLSNSTYDMQSGSLSAILEGTVGMTKTTTGTVIITSANLFTGATTITGGTLQLDGSLDSASTVGVGTAGTLSGSGTVNGNATLTGSGVINFTNPGVIAGTLGVTGGNWNGAGSVTGAVTSSSGTFIIGAGANLTATGGLNVTGGTIASGSATSTITGNVNYTSSSSSTFAGVIAGSGKTVTMNGSGATLTLSGTNTYTGVTTVSAGILNIQNATGLGTTAGSTTVSNGATLQLQGGITVGAEALSLNGGAASGQTGALVNVSGTNTYGGAVTVTASSSISAASGSVLNLTGGVVKNGTTATFNGGGTINVGTVGISGSSANSDLVIDGTTVNLNVANTYNGPTFIRNSATLNANVVNALPTANGRTAVTFDGTGTSVLGLGADQSVASLTSAGAATVTLGVNTLTMGSSSGSTTFAGAIGGTGGLIKDGASTQIFTGASNYTGTTVINAGTLVLNKNTSYASSTTTVNASGTLELTSTDTTVDNWRITSVLTGSGTINKTGAGWVMTNTNPFTASGTFNVQQGTFGTSFLTSDWTGVTADFNISSGALLDARGQAITVGSLNGSGNVGTTWNSAASVNVGAANKSGSFSGVISGNATSATNLTSNPNAGVLSLTKSGTGTQILSGANIYTGATTISAGTLQIGAGGTTGSLSTSSAITNNATLVFNRSNTVAQGTDFASVISGSGAVTQAGTGTLVLSGANTYTGATTINSGGTLQIGAGGTMGALSTSSAITNNGTLTFNRSNTITQGTDFNSVISGSGAVTQAGSGTVVLNGANTYTGVTTVSAGILNIQNADALGTTAAGTTVASGAALQIRGSITTAAEALTLNGTGVSNDGALLSVNGTNVYAGLVTLGSDTRINATASNLTLSNAGTITGAGFGLTLGSTNNLQIDSIIGTGSGTLTKDGVGTLILTGANTYSGVTTVSEGLLNIRNNAALGGTAGETIVASGATLQMQGAITTANEPLTLNGTGVGGIGALNSFINNNTYSGLVTLGSDSRINASFHSLTLSNTGTITGSGFGLTVGGGGSTTINSIIGTTSGTVTKDGAGTLTLTGANTYTGTTTISAGSLSIGAGGTTGSLATSSAIVNNATLIFNRSNTLTQGTDFATVISGSGAVTQAGSGTTILSGANTYTGATTVSAGTLQIGNGGTTGSLSTSSAITNNSALIFNRSNTVTQGTDFATVIGGSGTVQKSGSGTLILSGANTYTGATTVSTGVLNIRNATALGTTAAGTSVTSGAALQVEGGITTGAEALTLNGTGVSTDGALRNISGTNNLAGLVTLGSATRINSDAGTLTLSNTGTITGSGFGLTVGGAGNTTINSGIGTGTGTLTKDGSGTLTLTAFNPYTGATTISGGTLVVQNAIDSSSYSIASGATFEVNTAVTRDLVSATFTGAGTFKKTGAGLLLWFATAAHFELSSGSLIDVQQGTFQGGSNNNEQWTSNLSNLNVASGAIFDGVEADVRVNSLNGGGTIKSGFVGLGLFLGSVTVGVDNGSGTFSGVLADSQGNGNYAKAGTGTQIFSGANTHTGTTRVLAGILNIQNSSALGTTLGTSSVSNGATLQLQGGISVGAEALSLNGGAASGQTGALVNVSGTNTYGGAITVTSSSSISAASGSVLNLTGGVVKNGTTATFNGGGTINVGTVGISGSSANSDLVIDGTTVNLNVANTYNGPTFIRNSGTLNANVTNALPTANGRTAVTFDGTGTSVLTLGAAQSVASLDSTGAATVTLGANTLTIGSASGSTTFAGSIGGSGGLTKDGASTVTLSGSNGYTGATLLSAGSLVVNGSIGSSSLTTIDGGTLLGTGTVGAIQLNSGGAINAGGASSAGTLSTGNIAIVDGQLQFNLGGTGSYDQINTTGAINLTSGGTGAKLVLDAISGYTATLNNAFTLVSNDLADAISGAFAKGTFGGTKVVTLSGVDYVENLLGSGYYGRINYAGSSAAPGTLATAGNDIVLKVVTPEITITESGSNQTDGGTYNFGNVNKVVPAVPLTKTFTIKNEGEVDLTGIVINTPTGAAASDYTLNLTGTASALAPGASTTFTISFSPGGIGTRVAAIAIDNNDLDENPFNLALTGVGTIARDAQLAWVNEYSGPEATPTNGGARAVAIRRSGDEAVAVYATGYVTNAAGNLDVYVSKHAADTGLVDSAWAIEPETIYDGSFNNNDEGMAIAVDGSGDAIVAGYTTVGNSNTDVWVAKYSGATGKRLWTHTYNGSASSWDGAASVAVDSSGNVAVTGYTVKGNGNYDIYVAKLSSAGALTWEGSYDGGNNRSDIGNKVVIDSSGNVIVAGYMGSSTGKKVCYATKLSAATGTVLWTHSRAGLASFDDMLYGLALDASNNPVIAGSLFNGISYDLYVSKLQSTSGTATATVLWEKITDPYGNNDAFYDVVVDGDGNVVAGGTSRGATNVHERVISKYNGSTGAWLWDSRLNQGFGNSGNLAFNTKLGLDVQNNVVVTGFAVSTIGDGTKDVYTAKLLSDDGGLLWEKKYPLPSVAGKNDEGTDIAATGQGDAYVVGYAGNASTSTTDFLVMRYAPMSPATQLANVITFPAVASQVVGTSVTLGATAPGGRVHYSVVSGSATLSGLNSDVLTFTEAGTVVVRGKQGGSSQYAAAADVDVNITVLPSNQTITFSLQLSSSYQSSVDLSAAAVASSGLAVTYTVESGPGSIAGNVLTFSTDGTVVVRASQAGNTSYNAATPVERTITATNTAPVIILSGIEERFAASYAGTGSGAEVKGVALDTTGGTINGAVTTGYTVRSTTGVDIRTAKYGTTGNLVWENIRSVSGADEGAAVKLDASGNVYVAGYTTVSGADTDMLVIKYDSAGAQQWEKTFTGTGSGGGADRGAVLALASDGSVVVAGYLVNATTGTDYFAARLNSSDGSTVWSQSYDGGFNGSDIVNAVALNAANDVVLAGYSQNAALNEDCYTIQVAAADGTSAWTRRFGGAIGGQDRISAVGLDSVGDVLVSGWTQAANFNIYTAKYAGGTGAVTWEVSYNGAFNKNDASYDMKVDSAGDVVVAATSSDASAVNDGLTLKFRGSTGEVAWATRYNGPANKTDRMTLVALDPYDNVIASGFSFVSNNTTDIYTAKYRKDTGTMVWEQRYNGADGFRNDAPNAIVADGIGGAWVGGYLSSTSNVRAQLLLRYAPPASTPPPPMPPPSDLGDAIAAAAPPPPAVTMAFIEIEQGDMASFAAQFVDADGNDTVSFTTELAGAPAGQVNVNAQSGDFEWQFDTSRIAPGEHQVMIQATDTAGASASVHLALSVTATLPDRTWRWQNFGSTAAAGLGANDADPDGDGLTNLQEFAFGLNPNAGSGGSGVRVENAAAEQGMRAVFRRRKDHLAAGLTYVVEFSSNLSDWTPSTDTPVLLSDDGVVEQAGVPFPPLLNGAKGQFFRVRVEQPGIGQ